MKIAEHMIRHYVSLVTAMYYDGYRQPPSTMQAYDPYIAEIERQAESRGDMEALRLGLQFVLATPGYPVMQIAMLGWPLSADEVRAIIAYIYSQLWPNLGPVPVGAAPPVEITPEISLDDWWSPGCVKP